VLVVRVRRHKTYVFFGRLGIDSGWSSSKFEADYGSGCIAFGEFLQFLHIFGFPLFAVIARVVRHIQYPRFLEVFENLIAALSEAMRLSGCCSVFVNTDGGYAFVFGVY
jgi:hypothetical protein